MPNLRIHTEEHAVTHTWRAHIRAYVFNAYGTLFDVHSAVGKHRASARTLTVSLALAH